MLHEIDLGRADLNLLVLFEVVLEARHVGRAADRLNLSPSAVSHGLGRLRAMLGDPLFLKTPKGVTPTDRAMQLAPEVATILDGVRRVVGQNKPFDPATSTRRFMLGAPDGASVVILKPLLDSLRDIAPGVAIGIRQLLPKAGEPSPDLAWRDALAEIEARAMDAAIMPWPDVPARFIAEPLYEEEFIVVSRSDHPFAAKPDLEAYCAAEHLVVSATGDQVGFVDAVLASQGLSRRVAVTVPNFLFALSVLAETRLISALPRRFFALHGSRFGLVQNASPVELPKFKMCLVLPRVAQMDAGLAWLARLIGQNAPRAEDLPA